MTAFVAATLTVTAFIATTLAVTTFVAATLTAFVAAATLALAAFVAAALAAFVAAALAAFVAFFTFVAVTFVILATTFAVIARRFVLVEAGAAARLGANATGPCQRTAGAEREETDRKECRETSLHEGSFGCELCSVVTMSAFPAAAGLVAMFATVSALVAFAFAALGAFAFTVLPAFAALGTFAFAALGTFAFAAAGAFVFFRFFAGAFVGEVPIFAVHTRRFGFFARTFVGETGAFAVHARRRFVLVEACAPARTAASGKRKRTARAEHEQTNG